MRRIVVSICLAFVILLQTGCGKDVPVVMGTGSYRDNGVTITDRGSYYDVVLDFTGGLTHRQIGEALAKGILAVVPNYEFLIDSYVSENITKYEYPYALFRVEDIKPQIDKDYQDELEGMASVFSGGDRNLWKDDKISRDEVFLFNLFPDVIRNTQCSYVSVFGSRSSTGRNITARNLDWYSGSRNQLPLLNCVTTYKFEDKELCSIGFLGFMGVITGINDSKVFAGIMDSQTGQAYDSAGKRSYVFDLRHALEKTGTIPDAAGYLLDPLKHYAVNYIVVFSDPEEGAVLENNISGIGVGSQRTKRALRETDSKLNEGISWGIDDSIGCVNSFMLYGNHDNHTRNRYNTLRWNNMKTQLMAKGPEVTADELKEVITYKKHSRPGTFSESGDLYNRMTLQTILFQPYDLALEVFFHPRDTKNDPEKPAFEKILLFR